MELGYLPSTSNLTGKKYKHFSVNSFTANEISPDKKTEFFYIGENINIIENLVRIFDCGYTAEDVEKSITIITKIVENRSSFPDVILVDGTIPASLLKGLNAFLSTNSSLSGIPLLIEASNLNEVEIANLRTISFIDEIVFLDKTAEKFLSKIRFIKKIKDSNQQKEMQKNPKELFKVEKEKNQVIKRAFDICISALLLIVSSPIFAIIAIAIKLESKGPVFYIAKRAGRGYKVFNFFKFRTMQVGADKKTQLLSNLNISAEDQSVKRPIFFKVNNDPCITKVGQFLRSTSLDELPQLLNVLLGDMSLVGNRPLPLYEAENLTTDVWAERFMAPAGITGLWQIKKSGQKHMSVEERISLDIAYANRNNFMYDLWIMANTPTALRQKSDA